MTRVWIMAAGIMGAAGVALAAAGAHAAAGAGLESAAHLLLLHAVAVLAGAAALRQGLLWPPLATIALAAWVLGASLFATDIAMRAFAGQRLFPFAAPAGGTVLIGGWLVLAIAAMVPGRGRA